MTSTRESRPRSNKASCPRLEVLEERCLLSAGDLDISFGNAGRVVTDFMNGSTDTGHAIAIEPDGQIVVVGATTAGGGGANFALARYDPDGSPDTDFSFDGRVATDFAGQDDEAFGVVLQPDDGKIIVVGRTSIGGGTTFALARYLPNGDLDLDFGTEGNGKVVTEWTGLDEALGVVLQPDGKIVVAGKAGFDMALTRYLSDGTLDLSFSDGGLVTTHVVFPGGSESATRGGRR
jgi:uncharacterized delta-60 repeat protein